MSNGVRAVEIKGSRKGLEIRAIGSTPRGRRILGRSLPIKATNPAEPEFKSELANAVEDLLRQLPLPL